MPPLRGSYREGCVVPWACAHGYYMPPLQGYYMPPLRGSDREWNGCVVPWADAHGYYMPPLQGYYMQPLRGSDREGRVALYRGLMPTAIIICFPLRYSESRRIAAQSSRDMEAARWRPKREALVAMASMSCW